MWSGKKVQAFLQLPRPRLPSEIYVSVELNATIATLNKDMDQYRQEIVKLISFTVQFLNRIIEISFFAKWNQLKRGSFFSSMLFYGFCCILTFCNSSSGNETKWIRSQKNVDLFVFSKSIKKKSLAYIQICFSTLPLQLSLTILILFLIIAL